MHQHIITSHLQIIRIICKCDVMMCWCIYRFTGNINAVNCEFCADDVVHENSSQWWIGLGKTRNLAIRFLGFLFLKTGKEGSKRKNRKNPGLRGYIKNQTPSVMMYFLKWACKTILGPLKHVLHLGKTSKLEKLFNSGIARIWGGLTLARIFLHRFFT